MAVSELSWTAVRMLLTELKGGALTKKRHMKEQVIRAMKQAEPRKAAADICRKLGVSKAAFHYVIISFGLAQKLGKAMRRISVKR